MTISGKARPSQARVREHRKRLRKQGLRPIQIWVPDVDSPEFIAEARRQSLVVANSPGEKENLAFIDSLSDWLFEPEKE